MSEYYLTDLVQENIPRISELLDEYGLTKDTIGGEVFRSRFLPNKWYKNGIKIIPDDLERPTPFGNGQKGPVRRRIRRISVTVGAADRTDQ